jgi:hypothetical protein
MIEEATDCRCGCEIEVRLFSAGKYKHHDKSP